MKRHSTARPFLLAGLLAFLARCGGSPPPTGFDTDPPDEDPAFLRLAYVQQGVRVLPFRLFVPEMATGRTYPLVLYLHGASSRGSDNLLQITKGSYDGTHLWTTPENQRDHPCFVLAPQCGLNRSWYGFSPDALSQELAWVLATIDRLRQQYPIDPDRLYVTGVSLGGSGTWDFVAKRPGLFAAAVPVCGQCGPAWAPAISGLPVWVFHGSADETVSVEYSRRMVAALRAAGGTPRYTEYDGAPHAIASRVYAELDLLPWVFAQRRAVAP